jgi:predicted nucleic acid-binding Zn finger protein
MALCQKVLCMIRQKCQMPQLHIIGLTTRYISNRFNDINNYADIVNKSEDSLIEYREKAVINKAEAEIELNT